MDIQHSSTACCSVQIVLQNRYTYVHVCYPFYYNTYTYTQLESSICLVFHAAVMEWYTKQLAHLRHWYGHSIPAILVHLVSRSLLTGSLAPSMRTMLCSQREAYAMDIPEQCTRWTNRQTDKQSLTCLLARHYCWILHCTTLHFIRGQPGGICYYTKTT